MKKKIKKNKLFLRIIILIPVFIIILVAHIYVVLRRSWHFLLYGGEWINFEKPERKNINDVYEMLKEMKESKTDLMNKFPENYRKC